MARNAAFGRLRPSDRLKAWWSAKSSTSRSNAILFLVVGSISVGLVWSAVSRDPSGSRRVASGARPGPTVPGSVTTPTSLGLRTVDVGPLAAPGSEPDTSTTAVGPAPVAAGPAPTGRAAPPVTNSTAPPTTVPNPNVIFTEAPPSPPTSQVRPGTTAVPATSLPPTTAPPTTGPPTTPPPTTAPPTTAPPTTSATLLPPLPRLLGP